MMTIMIMMIVMVIDNDNGTYSPLEWSQDKIDAKFLSCRPRSQPAVDKIIITIVTTITIILVQSLQLIR